MRVCSPERGGEIFGSLALILFWHQIRPNKGRLWRKSRVVTPPGLYRKTFHHLNLIPSLKKHLMLPHGRPTFNRPGWAGSWPLFAVAVTQATIVSSYRKRRGILATARHWTGSSASCSRSHPSALLPCLRARRWFDVRFLEEAARNNQIMPNVLLTIDNTRQQLVVHDFPKFPVRCAQSTLVRLTTRR